MPMLVAVVCFSFLQIETLKPAVHAGDINNTIQIIEIMPTLNFIFVFILFPQILSNYNNIII